MGKSLTELITEIVLSQSSRKDMTDDEISSMLMKTYRTMQQIQNSERGAAMVAELKEEKQPAIATEEQQDSAEQAQLPAPEQETQLPSPAVSQKIMELRKNPKESIQEDKIYCLYCGKDFKQLSHKHLAQHGLTAEIYRKEYGFSKKQPLTATSVSEKRKQKVREMNLADTMKKAREEKRKDAAEKASATSEG